MALPTKLYGAFALKLLKADVDLDTAAIKIMLATNTYVPDQDVHDFRDDVTNELATANGYTAGGVSATGEASPVYDAATNEARYGAAIVGSWTFTGTVSCRWAIAYVDRGGAASADELVAYGDLSNGAGGNVSLPALPFTITMDPTGLLKLTVA